jgi:hypothetical protein
MGVTCSMHGGDEKCVQNFRWKASREETARKTYVWMGFVARKPHRVSA